MSVIKLLRHQECPYNKKSQARRQSKEGLKSWAECSVEREAYLKESTYN